MTIAIYPGSFDPITRGHLDIIEAGSNIFDRVIIAVSNNISKNALLGVSERKKLIQDSVKHLINVEVDSYDGLTVNFAKEKGATVLLRGLRTVSDFEYEMHLSQNNSILNENIKTVFLITKPEYSFISSSAVKEILAHNGDISKLVPEAVYKYFAN